MKRLLLFYDGTWNTPETRTNVWKLRYALTRQAPDGTAQLSWYDEGVGTHWYDRIPGGAFGAGLSENVRQGYEWLAEHFTEGDEIFLFGFSRGAFTARSLAGLIRKCGVLCWPDKRLVQEAYDLYRNGEIKPDSPTAAAFRDKYSLRARIRFIGVFDTVGALGIPLSGVVYGRDQYQFHDTRLSRIVDSAYQALAVDEHRKDYSPVLWTPSEATQTADMERAWLSGNREVEQRWFVGVHANIGGGYKDDKLCNLPLQWIQSKAEAAGVSFAKKYEAENDDCLGEVRDSYKEFMWGIYSVVSPRLERPILSNKDAINEQVDGSVERRWRERNDYRPKCLAEWAKDKGLPT